MRYWHDEIVCKNYFLRTKRDKHFCIIGYQFDYTNADDKALLEGIIESSAVLSKRVNVGAANDSTSVRSNDRLFANCIAGLTSEYCWKHFLNYRSICVRTTPFESAANQIDLEIIANKKRIEVRSSFPRNGISFAICHPEKEFDILGPYSNSYKPGEVHKDYYVRTLFHLDTPLSIIDKIRSSEFNVYLTGGATHDMMFNPALSKEKDLIPEDTFGVQERTAYRVVPFHNALDCREIYRMITNET